MKMGVKGGAITFQSLQKILKERISSSCWNKKHQAYSLIQNYMAPANHMGAAPSTRCSTSNSAPYYWPEKAAKDHPKLAPTWETQRTFWLPTSDWPALLIHLESESGHASSLFVCLTFKSIFRYPGRETIEFYDCCLFSKTILQIQIKR